MFSYLKWLCLGLGAIFFAVANVFVPILRFTSAEANATALLAVAAIPLLLTIYGILRLPWWLKLLNTVLLVPFLLLALGVGGVLWFDWPVDGLVDLSFEPVNQVSAPAYKVIAYRQDGGATTNLGIEVRQERKLGRGLKLVRTVAKVYPADLALLNLDENLLTVVISSASSGGQPTHKQIRLKPWVYF